jgi:hypothetical protein
LALIDWFSSGVVEVDVLLVFYDDSMVVDLVFNCGKISRGYSIHTRDSRLDMEALLQS